MNTCLRTAIRARWHASRRELIRMSSSSVTPISRGSARSMMSSLSTTAALASRRTAIRVPPGRCSSWRPASLCRSRSGVCPTTSPAWPRRSAPPRVYPTSSLLTSRPEVDPERNRDLIQPELHCPRRSPTMSERSLSVSPMHASSPAEVVAISEHNTALAPEARRLHRGLIEAVIATGSVPSTPELADRLRTMEDAVRCGLATLVKADYLALDGSDHITCLYPFSA